MLEVTRLISRGEACRLLGIGYDTLLREVKEGRLPVIRLGRRRIMFDRADLLDYIERCRTTGGSS